MSEAATATQLAAFPVVPQYLVEQTERAIDRADAKAAALAAVALAILPGAAHCASAVRGSSANTFTQLVFWVGLFAWGAGIIALASAILPRLRRIQAQDGEPLASFYDLPTKFDLDKIRTLIGRAADDPELWLLLQSHVLGRIAVTKYRMIRIGMLLIGSGALAGACGALIS